MDEEQSLKFEGSASAQVQCRQESARDELKCSFLPNLLSFFSLTQKLIIANRGQNAVDLAESASERQGDAHFDAVSETKLKAERERAISC